MGPRLDCQLLGCIHQDLTNKLRLLRQQALHANGLVRSCLNKVRRNIATQCLISIGVILGLYWGYIRVILGLYWGYIGVILGLYWGYIGDILGLYWGYIGDNGKENGNYYI